MKKKLRLFLLLSYWISLSFVSAYQQQGFDSYSETTNNTISFICNGQCLIFLGEKWTNDSLFVDNITGQGQIIVGALWQNNQLVPITQEPITNNKSFYQLPIENPQIGEIPPQAQIVLVFVGDIQATESHTTLQKLTFWEKVIKNRSYFRKNEGQTFYWINLRYGQKIWNTSIIVIWYRLFLFGAILLLFKNKLSLQNLFYLSVILILLVGIRNQIDYSKTTRDNLQSYTFAQAEEKNYSNLWDYYEFISKVRNTIWLDQDWQKQCMIYLHCAQERPYCAHLETVFIQPCTVTKDITKSNYQLYYKQWPDTIFWEKILEFNGSFLYSNK